MNFNHWGIRARITAGLALILLLSVLSAVNSLYKNTKVKYETSEVAVSWIPAIENLGHMKGFVADHYLAVSDRMAGRDTSDATAFNAKLKAIETPLAKATEIYAATLLTYTEENAAQGNAEKALYADYQAKRDAYFKLAQEALTGEMAGASDADKLKQVHQTFSAKAPDAFRQAYVAMEEILKFNLEGTAGAATKAAGIVSDTENAMLMALIVIVVVGGTLIWVIPRGVMVPVQQAVALAQKIADGDLTTAVVVHRNDELGHLLQNLESMQSRLVQLVSNVREGSESVSTASAEIAQGNNDLSMRTEQQASALQETASRMDSLGSTVRQNADSARQANQLAMTPPPLPCRVGKWLAKWWRP